MLRILLLCLLFIGLYRFITRVVFPILRITTAVRGQMRHMQQQHNTSSGTTSEPAYQPKSRSSKGDYIDFEEVK